MHIAIAGNIGSGKTTLTKMLAAHYGWTPKFESVDFNPYLADFYEDMERWSFNLQIYFLNKRLHDVIEIGKSKDVIIQDRTVMEGVNIFVANNYAQGNLSERDYNTFMDSYNVMMEVVKQPDLLIYLKSSIEHLVAQIAKRGRDYEQGISIDYLAGLNERYEEWIGSYTGRLITIDVDDLDFLNRPEDFALITDRIDAELYGLF